MNSIASFFGGGGNTPETPTQPEERTPGTSGSRKRRKIIPGSGVGIIESGDEYNSDDPEDGSEMDYEDDESGSH